VNKIASIREIRARESATNKERERGREREGERNQLGRILPNLPNE